MPRGVSKEIPARLHTLDSLTVEAGGTLNVQANSSRWTILWVKGDVTIHGVVTARQFLATAGTVTDKTPDGKLIEHRYPAEAVGGSGGDGGVASQLGAGSRNGGRGATGTTQFGGGGGSGGGIFIQGPSTRLGGEGRSATDFRGAPLADGGFQNRGGDGVRANPYRSGGLLMIYCGGVCNFKGAVFNLTGSNGEDGRNGGSGTNSTRGTQGGGGGGGGAPGGDGGHLIVVGDNLSQAVVSLAPGAGGNPGKPGQPAFGATPGYPADAGQAGLQDHYTMEEWSKR